MTANDTQEEQRGKDRPQLDPKALERIGSAIDRVYERLLGDGSLGFKGHGERMAFYHERGRRTARSWRRSKKCMFPECSDATIKRSHSIPRSGPMVRLAEDGHLLTPVFDKSQDDLSAKLVGVGEASTFPGYCPAHEAEFQTFEQNGELAVERDVWLQYFRIVCREIREREEAVQHMDGLLRDHQELLSERGLELLKEELGGDFIRSKGLDGKSMSFQDFDPNYERLATSRDELSKAIGTYRKDYLDPLVKALKSNIAPPLKFVWLRPDIEIPVALVGRANFGVRVGEQTEDVVIWPQVWPKDGSTDLLIMCTDRDDRHLDEYVKLFTTSPLGVIAMVESWMVHGTDHWFLRPSTWTQLPPARRSQILNDILDETRNAGSEYQHSIFDSIRQQVVAQLEKADPPPKGLNDYLIHERAKLALA